MKSHDFTKPVPFYVCVVIAVITAGPCPAATLIEIPTFGGPRSEAHAINNSGIVVGDSMIDANTTHAFAWSDRNGNNQADANEVIDLGTFAQGDASWNFGSHGRGINESGLVCGASHYTPTTDKDLHAFRWYDANGNGQSDPNEMEDLGDLGGGTSWALGINDQGVAVGFSKPNPDHVHAARWCHQGLGGIVDLGTLQNGDWAHAKAINNNGIVAGCSDLEPGPSYNIHACIWVDDKIRDIGTLGGTQSTAFAVNDNNMVVGDSHISGDNNYHAFLFDADANQMVDLGAAEPNGSSHAFGINNHGTIVGQQWLPRISNYHASMYAGGVWVDLHEAYLPPEALTSSATAINDENRIVGWMRLTGGDYRAWVLKLGSALRADINKDGIVNFFDFAILTEEWLKTEPWYPGSVSP